MTAPYQDNNPIYTTPAPRKKRRLILKIFLALVVLALIGGTAASTYFKIKFANFKPPMPPPGVVVSKVEAYEFADKIEAIGNAEADGSATLTTSVTETIKSVNIEGGTFVKAGTVLLELNSDEEEATLNEATRSYNRYAELARKKIASTARQDEEQARMSVAKAQLDKRRIIAPFDGILGLKEVSVGDLVSPGTVVATIDDIDPIEVEFSVPEASLSMLKTGLPVQAITDAFPNQVFKGEVANIDSRVNPDTRAIRVKAKLDNADFKLKPGLLMRIDVVKSQHTALAVPEEAIMAMGEKNSVTVIGSDNKAQAVEVKIGLRQAGAVEVLSGLKEGDKVVVDGALKAQPGTEVKIIEERSIKQRIESAMQFAVPRKQDELEAKPATDAQDESTTTEMPPLQPAESAEKPIEAPAPETPQ